MKLLDAIAPPAPVENFSIVAFTKTSLVSGILVE